eukprot:1586809-Lingulodinium_polyedra.AAC.1
MEASQPEGELREAVFSCKYTGFAELCPMLRKTLLDVCSPLALRRQIGWQSGPLTGGRVEMDVVSGSSTARRSS